MTTYSTCIFCGKNDSKPSKEDVLPRWIAREFPDARFRINDIENSRTFRTVNHFGVTSKAPCTRCNNGWMSHLESEVQPVLSPMLHGESVTLEPVHQLLLSRWLIKTAIMYDYRYKNQETYFTPDECRDLMRSLSVPPDTLMFLAVYLGKTQGTAQAIGVDIDPEHLPETDIDWRDFQTYSATFSFNTLVLQTFSCRRPKKLRDAQLSIEIDTSWPGVDVQIWPVANTAMLWPPRCYLDNALMADFVERFAEARLVPRLPL